MGLFDGITEDFEDVAEFSVGVPPGVYEVLVSNVETDTKGENDTPYLVISYTITDGPLSGRTHKEFLRIVIGGAQSQGDTYALQGLKTRLKSFGVPDSKMKSVTPDELTGLEGTIILAEAKNPQYRTVRRFTPTNADMADVSVPEVKAPEAVASDNPFA